MADGIITELDELIALRRYAKTTRYRPHNVARRPGAHVSQVRGRGMDFAEVRNYQAGDDIRHMEWRMTARTGRPHVKLYQEERERPVIIMTDFSPSMYFGTRVAFKSVIAARLAAILAWTVVSQGDRMGGLLFSLKTHDEYMPRAREMGVLPFLAGLCRYTKAYETSSFAVKSRSFGYALQRVRRVMRPGSMLVLISDFYNWDADSERHLNRLRIHNDTLAYHICDPLETAPPNPQPYVITNGAREIFLDTRANDVRAAYLRYCDERLLALQTSFKRLQIPCVTVTSATDLPLLVQQTFPRRVVG